MSTALLPRCMTHKVLIIEDNTDWRELFAMLVRHLGFVVIESADGEIGVQKALVEKPDLIFMDIDMPSMSGIQAIACLRESATTKDTPIIVCTGWTAQNHREAALRCGAQAVIGKPVSVSHLQTLLLSFLPRPTEPLNVQ
jgi:two-component system, cell cycle response regulator DivK